MQSMEAEGLSKSPPQAGGFSRDDSMDTAESSTHLHLPGTIKVNAGIPPSYGRGSYGFAPPPYPPNRAPIKSVVTTSFEEREDRMMEHRDAPYGHREYGMRHGRSPPHHGSGREEPLQGYEPLAGGRDHYQIMSPRDQLHSMERDSFSVREGRMYTRELPPIREGDVERRHPAHEMMRTSRETRVPPSPRGDPSFINRTLSSSGSSISSSYRGQVPLKRSFWHHAREGEDLQTLPNEFMPPKRSKVTPPSGKNREYIVTARPHEEIYQSERFGPSGAPSRSPGWFNRAMSWEASRDDYYNRDPASKLYTGSWSSRSPPSYRDERHGPQWTDAPEMPSPRSRYSHPDPGYEPEPPTWHRWHHPEEHQWGPPMQHRDEANTKPMSVEGRERESFERDVRRQGTFESGSGSDGEPPMRFIPGPSPTSRGMEPMSLSHKHSPLSHIDSLPIATPDKRHNGTLLLAQPEDRISLSETLCLVRENIEVFTATPEDVEAPAPGRKHAVNVGQVGLRCIHCRHTTRSSDRVKRAVCYPSSIKRIYRTVIDMKLDHFLHCKFVPKDLKETLNALKANNTRSTGTTMQYFIRAAQNLGMADAPNGVRMLDHGEASFGHQATSTPMSKSIPKTPRMAPAEGDVPMATPESAQSEHALRLEEKKSPLEYLEHRNNSMTSESSNTSALVACEEAPEPTELFTGQVALSLPEDKTSLSPLRCFLREQVCAFSATEEDIAVRTPTTFSVSVGQVGIGCIHCLSQPAKLRLNRAVCFPFSIARIYQSVADIQRFHLNECKMVPPDIKKTFLELQSASSKGSKGLATRQYWVTSAKKLGLVDTAKGIRFGRDPTIPEEKAVSLDILAQVASHVNTVNRPLVLPEDKPLIADFLYVVMEQLQACRFTEADRNKRRLKDVGCIGVECKHCAGQVDSRKFFWSSVNAVESNFVSVHTHMMECKMVPEPLKDHLSELKKLRKEQTSSLKTGSQKAFFSRVWERLHGQEQAAAKAAEEAAKKKEMEAQGAAAANTTDDNQKMEEEKPMADEKEVTRTDSVDEIYKESMEATPVNSPIISPEKMDVSPAPETPMPTSPASSDKMKAIHDKMAIVSV